MSADSTVFKVFQDTKFLKIRFSLGVEAEKDIRGMVLARPKF